MGWIGCVRCEKFQGDFVARTFALVRPVLHRVSQGNQTVPNAPKCYETHQNSTRSTPLDPKLMFWGPMGWIGCLCCEKFRSDFVARPFCTSSARFAPSFVRQPNGPECTKIVRNAPKCQFGVQWGGLGAFVAKNSDPTSWHELLHYFGPFCTKFRMATKRSRMLPNSTKHTKMLVYGPMGWIRCVRCEKFRHDFVAQTFALVRPVLHRVS